MKYFISNLLQNQIRTKMQFISIHALDMKFFYVVVEKLIFEPRVGQMPLRYQIVILTRSIREAESINILLQSTSLF